MTAKPETRERDVIRAFVDLSNELVDGYDIVELLTLLTTSCARLLDVASAGLLLADPTGPRFGLSLVQALRNSRDGFFAPPVTPDS